MIEPPEDRDKSIWRRAAIVAAVLLVMLGLGYGVYGFVGRDTGVPKTRVVETVVLKLIPPPPPPPPPPVEKPPEPQKMLEQQKLLDNKPPEKPQEARQPPPGPLGLDAKGGPGNDGFGLAGRPGGNALIGGGGGGGSRFGWYANIIQTQIQQALQKDEKLRSGRYRITLSVWLSAAGKAERVSLVDPTGDREIDERIQQTLVGMPPLPQGPPQDMPQPVRLRIDARPSQ